MKSLRLAVAFTTINFLLLLGVVLRERAAAAQRISAVLRARAIELDDGRGRVRAQLDVEAEGEVVFRLRDSNGTIRVKLGASESGSGLVMADEATEPGVHILATRSGTSLTLQRGARRRVISP